MRASRPLLAAALVLLASARASAAPSTVATRLFDEGHALMEAGSFDLACPKLAQSFELDAALGTLLNLAHCHEKQGKTATAWSEFRRAGDMAAAADDGKRRDYARKRMKALVPLLPSLVLRAQGKALVVRLDGADIGAASLDTPIPVDPGDHQVEISAPGKRTFAATVKVPAGPSTQTLEVPPLADETSAKVEPPPAPPPAPAPPVAAPAPAPPAPPSEPPSTRSLPRFVAGLAVGGVGLAGVVVGSMYGIQTFQKKAKIGASCDATGCDPTGMNLQRDAHRAATISTVAFAVGLTAVAGGVVLVATSGTKAKTSAWLAPAPGGLVVGGTF